MDAPSPPAPPENPGENLSDTAGPPGLRKRNLTSFLLGHRLTSRLPPQREMAIIARGGFALHPDEAASMLDPDAMGPLTGPIFAEDDDLQEGECLYPGDLDDFKPRGEVLIKGTARAQNGALVPLIETSVRIGPIAKRLHIFGTRFWTRERSGASQARPEPFSELPISWRHAFGGDGFAANPAGTGNASPEMPRIEDPARPITSPDDRPPPVGYGPINANWPPRTSRKGRNYGASYRARAPFYADDFDWGWFNAAPEDQWIDGFWRGDEELHCTGFFHDRASLRARLPGLRTRVFLRYHDGRSFEPDMRLDTIWLDLDTMRVSLTWRGHAPVEDDYFRDVQALLLGCENLAEAKKEDAFYLRELDHAIEDPYQIDALPADIQAPARAVLKGGVPSIKAGSLGKPTGPAGKAALAALNGVLGPALARTSWGKGGATGAPANPLSSYIEEKLGTFLKPVQTEIKQQITQLGKATGERGFDLTPHLRRVTEAARASTRRVPTAAPSPGAYPKIDLRSHVRKLAKLAGKVKGDLQARGVSADLGAFDKLVRDPRIALLSPGFSADEILDQADKEREAGTDDEGILPGPGADLRERDFRGQNLKGHDFSGARLDKALLDGADLTGANLAGACLAGARLDKARLHGADLRDTDLRGCSLKGAALEAAQLDGAHAPGADFSGALLKEANLGAISAKDAIFREANCTSAIFREAMLERADFTGARLDGAVWDRVVAPSVRLADSILAHTVFTFCDLTRSSGERARATLALFEDCDLTEGNWTGANFEQCRLLDCTLDGCLLEGAEISMSGFTGSSLTRACFERAHLRMVSFGKTILDRTRFREATGQRCFWVEATLRNTDFHGAILVQSWFLDAELDGCDLTHADLRASSFRRARITASKFTGANLFGTDFAEASLEGNDCVGVNLFEAHFGKAKLIGCDFRGANLLRANLDLDREAEEEGGRKG